MIRQTIRYLVLQQIMNRLSDITVAKGFETDIGANALFARLRVDPDSHPSVVCFPQTEERENYRYNTILCTLVLSFEATLPLPLGADPMELVESARGDLISAFSGFTGELNFTTGSAEILPGQIVKGSTSDAESVVESITVNSGSWVGEDAAGILVCRNLVGQYTDGETLYVVADDVAVVSSTVFSTTAEYLTSDAVIDDIVYNSGGPVEYPENAGDIVSTQLNFTVSYIETSGNPYSQE